MSNYFNIVHQIVSTYKPQSYCDVGPLYGTVGESISSAYFAGCTNLTVIDLDYKPWIDAFIARMKELKIPDSVYKLHLQNFLEYNGVAFDIVYCSGLLYHFAKPEKLLRQLYKFTNKICILGSLVVPPSVINNKAYICLPETHHNEPIIKLARQYWRENFPSIQTCLGIDTQSEFTDESNTADCWWIFTREYVEKLCTNAGFTIKEYYMLNNDSVVKFVLGKD